MQGLNLMYVDLATKSVALGEIPGFHYKYMDFWTDYGVGKWESVDSTLQSVDFNEICGFQV